MYLTSDKKEKAVEEALLQNYDRYYRMAYSYVHNPQDAGDIVQEGAYRALVCCDSLKDISYAATWVYRIMVNGVFDHLKRRRTVPLEEVPEEGREDCYADTDLQQALEGLGDKDRMVIQLRFFEDMKLEEIAQVLDENVGTVKSRLYRGMKKLRLKMEE